MPSPLAAYATPRLRHVQWELQHAIVVSDLRSFPLWRAASSWGAGALPEHNTKVAVTTDGQKRRKRNSSYPKISEVFRLRGISTSVSYSKPFFFLRTCPRSWRLSPSTYMLHGRSCAKGPGTKALNRTHAVLEITKITNRARSINASTASNRGPVRENSRLLQPITAYQLSHTTISSNISTKLASVLAT